ncbi:MAG: FimV/HubP family polar landmark protein, partial [Wenzhouxiangella sp.]|nr:FimV/HubP family polar landmark protein [Wenzhouxiangella sp.]
AKPEDLGAHLALLAALADRDDPDGFSAALDNMYRQVDDEDGPEWQEALNMAVIHAPDHPLLTPPETGLATDDDDEGLDDRTREMLGILPSSDEADTMAVEPDDYEFDSELEADRAEPDDIFSTESESYSRTSDQDTVRTSPTTESEDEDVEGHDLDLAELSRRLDTPEEDQPPGDDDEGQDEPDLTFAPETDRDDSTQVLPSAPVADEPDADDIDDELAADDPLRLDFEFSDRSSSGDTGRDQTLPLSDEFDLSVEAEDSSEDDLDTDELGADLAAEDDDLVDLDGGKDRSGEREESLDERGDRELEAFLSQDDDEGEPELSDEDAEVKLDLARAYLSMDDPDSARTLLEEITSGGSAAMRAEARKLLDQD